VRRLGVGCYMAKVDIKAAYRTVPVRPADWPLLGMHWQDRFYFHRTLPFGLRSSCHLWERYATAAEWIATHSYLIQNIRHYVDDFFLAGTTEAVCNHDLHQFLQLLQRLGLPVADDKTEESTKQMLFPGILIDTSNMTISLDDNRVNRTLSTLRTWEHRQTCSV
jgi:hypothetical protein